MPGLIRHPVSFWIPASAGTTTVGYLSAGAISYLQIFGVADPVVYGLFAKRTNGIPAGGAA